MKIKKGVGSLFFLSAGRRFFVCAEAFSADRKKRLPTPSLARFAIVVPLPILATALAVVVLMLSCFAPIVSAQQAGSLDEQLLEDLGKDPLDTLDRELFSRPDKKTKETGSPPGGAGQGSATGAELEQRLLRELGRAAESEADSPLLTIARTMQQVEQRIAKANSGKETQQLQSQILDNLDELLEQARSRCQGGKPSEKQQQKVADRQSVEQPKAQKKPKQKASGGGRDPTPAIASPNQFGPGATPSQQPSREEWGDLVKALWGELPQREREQMAQFFDEEFLPKYELLIEQYFRRLAEEQGRQP